MPRGAEHQLFHRSIELIRSENRRKLERRLRRHNLTQRRLLARLIKPIILRDHLRSRNIFLAPDAAFFLFLMVPRGAEH